MKAAYQKDGAFLGDVRRALTSRASSIWWLGQSGFLIVRNGRAMVLDPYLSDSLTRKYASTDRPHVRMTELVVEPAALCRIGVIDLITSSHNHTDHFDPETLLPLLQTNRQARLIVPAANREVALERLGKEVANRLIDLDDGRVVRLGRAGVENEDEEDSVGEMQIRAVASAHNTVEKNQAGHCRFLGYVIKWGELSFYHSGDTVLHDGLVPALKPLEVDVALLPINGNRPERRVAGNLDGREAAQLAHAIGARCVIPCHYDMFEFNTASPEEFISECKRLGQAFRILRNGEGWQLDSHLRKAAED